MLNKARLKSVVKDPWDPKTRLLLLNEDVSGSGSTPLTPLDCYMAQPWNVSEVYTLPRCEERIEELCVPLHKLLNYSSPEFPEWVW